MKIGIDGRSSIFYSGSGIGNYSYELIKTIKNSPYKTEILSNEVNIKKSHSFWSFTNIPLKLYKKYDIFFNPHNGIGLPLDNSYKLIVTLHDIIPSKLPKTVSKTYLKIFNKNIDNILNRSDGIITVSKYSKNDICNTFSVDRNKVFVTYIAPSKIYRPINKLLVKSYLKKMGINFKYLLYVGSSSPRKNIIGLIEAFSKLNKSKLKLLIVGANKEYCDDYINRARELCIEKEVIFMGFVKKESLPYLYGGAVCFLYPSFYEGFGLPPLEAMSCGTPVITSNVTSLPEILKDNAIYIDPYNPNSIYEKTNLLINHKFLRETYRKKGLTFSKNFSWEKTSINTLNAFKKIQNL